MTVNYTTNLALGQPVTGSESGTWGDDANNAVTSYLDIAIAGGLAITVTTADVTLTLTQGTSVATNIGSTTAQYAILNVSGAMTAARSLIVPSSSRSYVVNNSTTGGFALTVKGSATTGVTLVNGEKAIVSWNGTDYVKISSSVVSNLTGVLPVVNGGTGVTTSTGTTNVVLSNSPTLVTPALGTPASGVVTNLTGTASININGTVGATTASSGAFTTLSATGVTTVQAGTAALPAITTTGDTNTGIFFPAADKLGFTAGGGTDQMVLTTTGLGIGTSSPGARLQVNTGTTATVGLIVKTFDTAGGTQPIANFQRSDAAVNLQIGFDGNTGDSFFGTTTNHNLSFISNNTERARISTDGTFRVTGAGTAGSTDAFQVAGGAPADAARIDSSGNLLVGCTIAPFGSAPGAALIKESAGGRLQTGANVVTARNAAEFYNPNGLIGTIVTAGGATLYNTTSDYRLKEAVAPMQGALARNALLNPVKYKWKADGSDGEGFIAHELQTAFPAAVIGEKDAVDSEGKPQYQGIGTGPLDGHFAACVNELTQLIQEQQAIITALTARITALESN